MAGTASFDSSPGIVLRAHHYIQNIETANLGHYYSKSLENINYFVVDCVAKPAIDKAPEWTYNNRVVDSIKTHRTLSLTLAGIVTAALFIYVVYLLHPKRAPDIADATPKKLDETPETALPGPDEAQPSGSPTKTTGKEPDGTEEPAKDANGAKHEEPLVQDASKMGGSPTKATGKESDGTEEPAKDANGAGHEEPLSEDKVSEKDKEIKDEDEKIGTSFTKESKESLKKNPSGNSDSNPFGAPSDGVEDEDIFASPVDKKKKGSDPHIPPSPSAATPPLTAAPGPSPSATGRGRGAPKAGGSPIPKYILHPGAAGAGRGSLSPVGNPSGSTPPIGGKNEFDLDAMTVEDLTSATGPTASLPPPGEKKMVDTLVKESSSGAPPASGDADPIVDKLEDAMAELLAEQNKGSSSSTGPKSLASSPVAGAEIVGEKEKKD